MVVDGAVTSNHSDKEGHEGIETSKDGWLYVLNRKIIHMHTLGRIVLSPHRVVCGHLITCTQDSFGNKSCPLYSEMITRIHVIGLEKQSIAFSVFALASIIAIGLMFSAIEFFLQNALVIVLGMGGWFAYKKYNKKVKVA